MGIGDCTLVHMDRRRLLSSVEMSSVAQNILAIPYLQGEIKISLVGHQIRFPSNHTQFLKLHGLIAHQLGR